MRLRRHQRQHWVFLVRRIAGKIDPRIKLLEHAAAEHRNIQMRRLLGRFPAPAPVRA